MRPLVTFLLATCAGVASAPSPTLELGARLTVPVRYASIFGQQWAYYEAGPASAPAVILVHSLGWDANAWAPNLPALDARFHVIAIDPLGVGKSAKCRWRSITRAGERNRRGRIE